MYGGSLAVRRTPLVKTYAIQTQRQDLQEEYQVTLAGLPERGSV